MRGILGLALFCVGMYVRVARPAMTAQVADQRDIKNHGAPAVTFQNSPMWNQALHFSNDIIESGVIVSAPADVPNTDGVESDSQAGSCNAEI